MEDGTKTSQIKLEMSGEAQNINPTNCYYQSTTMILFTFYKISWITISLASSFVWLTQTSTWCSTSGINHFGCLVRIIILKIRKSGFSVSKHLFCGRRETVDLVSCEETQTQVLSTLLQGVTKNRAVRRTSFIVIFSRTNDQIRKWLELK